MGHQADGILTRRDWSICAIFNGGAHADGKTVFEVFIQGEKIDVAADFSVKIQWLPIALDPARFIEQGVVQGDNGAG